MLENTFLNTGTGTEVTVAVVLQFGSAFHALGTGMVAASGEAAAFGNIDGTLDFGRGDEAILRLLENTPAPKLLAINKTDLIGPEKYLELYNRYESTGLFDDIYGVSALRGDNIDMLRDRLAGYMNEGPMYYPDDIATEDPARFIVSEIIREKLMNYQIFSENEWSDIKSKHHIHELGYLSNLSPNYEDVIKNKRNDRKFEYLDDDISYGNGVRHKYDFNNIESEESI